MSPFITESTPLTNPHWQYSRDKIACEEFLMEKYRTEGYPVTVIRPSHTYDDRRVRRTIENILSHPALQEPDPEFDAWCDRVIAAMEQAKASLR